MAVNSVIPINLERELTLGWCGHPATYLLSNVSFQGTETFIKDENVLVSQWDLADYRTWEFALYYGKGKSFSKRLKQWYACELFFENKTVSLTNQTASYLASVDLTLKNSLPIAWIGSGTIGASEQTLPIYLLKTSYSKKYLKPMAYCKTSTGLDFLIDYQEDSIHEEIPALQAAIALYEKYELRDAKTFFCALEGLTRKDDK